MLSSRRILTMLLFSFLHRHDEAFSTEPMKNSPNKGGGSLQFNHVQTLSISMSKAFLHYVHHFPIIFEACFLYNTSTVFLLASGLWSLSTATSAEHYRQSPSITRHWATMVSILVLSPCLFCEFKSTAFQSSGSFHVSAQHTLSAVAE